MATEAAFEEAQQLPTVEQNELRDIERIKALVVKSSKTLDNNDIAKKLGLDPDYVEKLCFDLHDGMIIEERQDEKPISNDEMMKWLKKNNLI
jgi:hypothetical protein